MFNVTTVLPHNLLQTNPCIRHNFSTQFFRKRAAQLHYVGPELRYIFWPPSEARKCCTVCTVWRILPIGNIIHTVHTSCHPTLQHHNSYNRTDNYRQWNAVGSPDDGHKDARNMLRYYLLPINHYLLHLFGFSFTYLSKIHGHSNIKFQNS